MTTADRLAAARAQLKALRELPDRWDTMTGKAPTAAALDVARALVENPRVPPSRVGAVALSEGAVELRWNGGVTVLVHPDGRAEITVARSTRSIEVAVSLVTAATAAEPERASAGAGGATP